MSTVHTSLQRAPVPVVLAQHLEDAAVLRGVRSLLVRAPHVKLHQLGRTDERLAAHLDGLAESGGLAREMAAATLAEPDSHRIFVVAVLAIWHQDADSLDRLLSVAEAMPELRAGLVSAFGWVPAPSLRGISKTLLDSASPFRRGIGLSSCGLHLVNPGAVLATAMASPDMQLEALRVAARLADPQHLDHCLALLQTPDPAVRAHAARAALLSGDRGAAVRTLTELARQPGPAQAHALQLVLKVLPPAEANTLLRPLAQDPADARTLIRGMAAAGDPHYVPWLIKKMLDPKLTRLAGEAFSTITGLDLAFLDLDRKPPEGDASGPNDDPADDTVALDEDDSLPWPDVDRIDAWWQANGTRFQAGTRYFAGEPPSVAQAFEVLRKGFQRQRIAAAEYLSLLRPGTPLFNVAAPASRQERQLTQMTRT